jgi:hypothetical protein
LTLEEHSEESLCHWEDDGPRNTGPSASLRMGRSACATGESIGLVRG